MRVEVTHTGPGIPADQRPRLFTYFQQLDGSVTLRARGTGLGLASRAIWSSLPAAGSGSTAVRAMAAPSGLSCRSIRRRQARRSRRQAAGAARPDRRLSADRGRHPPATAGRLGGVGRDAEQSRRGGGIARSGHGLRHRDRRCGGLQRPCPGRPTWRAALGRASAGDRARPEPVCRSSSHRLGAAPPGHDLSPARCPGPIVRPDAPADETALVAAAADAATTVSTVKPLRLLLVEDNPVNQEVARMMLAAWGHRIDSQRTGSRR